MGRSLDLTPLRPWLTERGTAKDKLLDAFEEAVVKYGIQAASFSRIADIAGCHRSLLQHHFHSRDQLVLEGLDRVIEIYCARQSALLAPLPKEKHYVALADWLLSEYGPEGQLRIGQVIDAYQALANTNSIVAQRLLTLHEHFISGIEEALAVHHPHTKKQQRRKVAFEIVCMCIGRACLDLLGSSQARSQIARRACDVLRATLDNPPDDARSLRPAHKDK